MPHVSHPWRKHFCDARFIVMEVDTSVMIILVMSWNTSTTAQVWLSWLCHKIVMDVHAWQKTRPTVTDTYHHERVFFVVYAPLLQFVVSRHHAMIGCDKLYVHIQRVQASFCTRRILGLNLTSLAYADMASEHWDRKVERESYSRYDQDSDVHHWKLLHVTWWSDVV